MAGKFNTMSWSLFQTFLENVISATNLNGACRKLILTLGGGWGIIQIHIQ